MCNECSKQSLFGNQPFISFYGCLPNSEWVDEGIWSYYEGHEINLFKKQIN